MSESLSAQERQRRGNPTRVDISYKVLEGTPVKKIPFRALVMGNLSGHTQDLPPLYEREFISIDRNNFDKVLQEMNPTLELDVKDTLSNDPDARVGVSLKFNKFEDFKPSNLIKQIPRLKELFDRREKLVAARRNLSDPKIAEEATKAIKDLKDK
jgi:type VI secretion system protein ImpB